MMRMRNWRRARFRFVDCVVMVRRFVGSIQTATYRARTGATIQAIGSTTRIATKSNGSKRPNNIWNIIFETRCVAIISQIRVSSCADSSVLAASLLA